MNRRQVALWLGLLATTCLVSALVVEGALRVYAGVAGETPLARALRVDPFAVLVEPHGEAGYRPRPGRTFSYDNGTSANVNEQGFRGPVVPLPKPAGTFRVVLVGGSTTFGWAVNDEETIDAHMREILAVRHPDRAIDVVSLAFDGYDSWQLFERIRTESPRFTPDVVIVNDGINDLHNVYFTNIQDGDRRTLLYRATMDYLRFEQARGGPTLWSRAKHYAYIARVPGWLRAQFLPTWAGQAGPGGAPPTYYWDALEYFERNIRRLIDVGPATQVLLSTPPSSLNTRYSPTHPPERTYWVHDAQTTQMYRDSLSARLQLIAAEDTAAAHVSYVLHEPLAPELFVDDAHLTSEGNRRMAEDFVAALEPLLAENADSVR